MFAGIAHAFLFPSVVGGGSTQFPPQYRGLGVTLMLSMIDLGVLIGAPLAGLILEGAGHTGLPPYPTMFIVMAVIIAMVGMIYFVSTGRRKQTTQSTASVAAKDRCEINRDRGTEGQRGKGKRHKGSNV